ncbi:NADP-dependent oxidoreductase [Parahaliea maris]|uniref:NADP-dependent oxidoreductase n=1 Tax=Parahaliea maris TaxID=2716870 RepID=A0A5C9A6N5_9GAMM|nr:NADP-dependent oxidoreductase [Parahaliea maris]TXS96448.1 NADP-dependent oxidoreductase [Parahaliea maris]
MQRNRQIILKSHVQGIPKESDFAIIEGGIPDLANGEFLIQNLYFSLEPAIRGWLEGKEAYFPPIPINGVVRGPTVGRVITSNNAHFHEGDIVFALNRWEDFSVCDDNTILLEKLTIHGNTPLSYYVGPLGGSGTTAYVGLHEIGHISSGQTVVVSAAAGATGSMVGQIAKLRGCKVIGIVGSDEKANSIVNELGMDAAINYKTCPDLASAVLELAPENVDVYFDNVGGPILDAMLTTMKIQGRIICCGMISDYNRTDNPNPITNLWQVVAKQLTMKGFLLHYYHNEIPAARKQLATWIADGKITVSEDITTGIAQTPAAFRRLMSGSTSGKALVEIDLV